MTELPGIEALEHIAASRKLYQKTGAHLDTGYRCSLNHGERGPCIRCTCGAFIPPDEWLEHRTPESRKERT